MSLQQLQSDPALFRAALKIDTAEGIRDFSDCVEPWQNEDFIALDPGWRKAVFGADVEGECRHGWLERSRGHSKTSDIAIMATWALFASTRPLVGIAAASDKDQSRLLRDAINRLIHCNPWLRKVLEIQSHSVVNLHTGSRLEIISSDAPSSYGLTPDFIICDEISNWQKPDLWHSLISSAAKRSTCQLVVITNAGFEGDWLWETREVIRNDDEWFFNSLDGPKASWITPKVLAAQKRYLPSPVFERLWLNKWTTGTSDALRPGAIEAAFDSDSVPMTGHEESGYEFVGGLDLGLKRDSSAFVILAVRSGQAGTIRLAHHKVWTPTSDCKIDLLQVEQHILECDEQFNLNCVSFDPWQAEHLAQSIELKSQYRRRGAYGFGES